MSITRSKPDLAAISLPKEKTEQKKNLKQPKEDAVQTWKNPSQKRNPVW